MPKQKKRVRKRIEYSKFLAAWALGAATVCLAVTYMLSANDHDPCETVTIAIVTAAASVVDFYMHKSYKEKDSRNRYGIDAEGNKMPGPVRDDPGGLG